MAIIIIAFFGILFLITAVFWDPFYIFYRSRHKELFMFSGRLSDYLRAEIPLPEAFDMLIEDFRWESSALFGVRFFDQLGFIKKELMEGSTLADSLSRYKKIFPAYFIEVVRMGEQTGTLPGAMEQLANYNKILFNIKRKRWMVLLYPLVLLFAFFMVLILIMIYIFPFYLEIMGGMGGKLSGIANELLNFISIMSKVITFSILPAIIIFAILIIFRKKAKGILDRIFFSFPVFSGMTMLYQYVLFSNIMNLLIEREESLDKAIKFAASTSSNEVFRKKIEKVADSDIPTFSGRLEESGVFSPSFLWMVKLGEKTENLSESLKQLGEYYSGELALRSDKISRICTFCLLLLTGSFVGFLFFSILSPIVFAVVNLVNQIVVY
ncbi:MAG: type II secretion system F family protein [Candidatus Eremiobacteraeota bacterium]|nr:type II secretion system F family protein [Candidatus Eremiobacteraeota bacterium]